MKTKIFVALGAILIAGGIGFAFFKSGMANAEPNLTTDDIREKVAELYPGTITELEIEKEGKQPIYEVELEIDGKAYELKIDGNTGEVLKLADKIKTATNPTSSENVKPQENNNEGGQADAGTSTKSDDNSGQAEAGTQTKNDDNSGQVTQDNEPSENQPKNNGSSTTKTVISHDEAKQIALRNFAGTIHELELDEDDGRLKYEVELFDQNSKAEIKIDAYTGAVLVIEIESRDDDYDDD